MGRLKTTTEIFTHPIMISNVASAFRLTLKGGERGKVSLEAQQIPKNQLADMKDSDLLPGVLYTYLDPDNINRRIFTMFGKGDFIPSYTIRHRNNLPVAMERDEY